MSREEQLERVLAALSPTTRREFLKQVAAVGGVAAAQAMLIKNPLIVTAAPSAKRGGMVRVMGHQEVASLSPDDAARARSGAPTPERMSDCAPWAIQTSRSRNTTSSSGSMGPR